jgi:hypothetical protein
MKTIDIAVSKFGNIIPEEYKIERCVHERVADSPFLVGLHYAFRTQSKACFVVGEYINNYS